jgi:hypothetical protein
MLRGMMVMDPQRDVMPNFRTVTPSVAPSQRKTAGFRTV